MRKNILYILTVLIIIACGKESKEQRKPITIDIDDYAVVVDTTPDSIRFDQQRRIQRELDYYLKRHSVADEGCNMVARYASEGSSMYADYGSDKTCTMLGMLRLKGIARQGVGMATDTCGRVYIGMWRADTLSHGFRLDSAGVYGGQFDIMMKPSGHGCYQSIDGTYYEGHWDNDKRNGFGFAVTTNNLQAGTWREGRFHGERIRHTSDRIYGIDISRYQHEKGRQRYPIDWSNLRVSHLGRRIGSTIAGDVDYPVRFVYIKSTQGTTIRNRYYATDYAAARRHNIPIGAYHFFSTVRSGKAQAQYFLTSTLFKRGDLPPVLDIEPSDKQIKQMGGTQALLREIRQWIKVVEQRVKVRPILYVNQRFVNDHLSQAPDLLDRYLIWIARYGEYKPGIHLALWQLSADARVKGIKTDVDVNVFNGYETQWEEFLNEEAIK